MAASCPPELLLEVFEQLEPVIGLWNPAFFRADVLAARHRSTWSALAVCARVCRAWAPVAQHVLYRELSVSSAARRDSLSREWDANVRNLALLDSLAASPGLGRTVEVLQTGVGDDCDHPTVYDTLDTLTKTLALCRNLVHLDLTLGCIDAAAATEFSPVQLATLAGLASVRHLSVHDSAHTYSPPKERCSKKTPSLRPLYQLLALWPGVQVLSLNVARAKPSYWSHAALPGLREIRVAEHAASAAAAISILQRARNLQHAILARPIPHVLAALPPSLPHLTFYALGDPASLGLHQLTSLETFSLVEGRHAGARDHRGASLKIFHVVDALSQLAPARVRSVTLPAVLIEQVMDRELLIHAVRRFHVLKRIVFEAGRAYSPSSAQSVMAVMKNNTSKIRDVLPSRVNVLVREVFVGLDDVPRMRPDSVDSVKFVS